MAGFVTVDLDDLDDETLWAIQRVMADRSKTPEPTARPGKIVRRLI